MTGLDLAFGVRRGLPASGERKILARFGELSVALAELSLRLDSGELREVSGGEVFGGESCGSRIWTWFAVVGFGCQKRRVKIGQQKKRFKKTRHPLEPEAS